MAIHVILSFFLMIGMGVFWVTEGAYARYTSDTLTNESNISLYHCIKSK